MIAFIEAFVLRIVFVVTTLLILAVAAAPAAFVAHYFGVWWAVPAFILTICAINAALDAWSED